MTTMTENAYDTLYATIYPDELEEALATGITGDHSGVLLTNRDVYSAGFIKMIGGIRISGFTNMNVNGSEVAVPSYERFHNVVVVVIDRSKLNPMLLVESQDDYSSPFYPKDMKCWHYEGVIDPSMFSGHETLPLSSPSIPMEP